VRLLWSLPKAAPALVRHLVAYAELAGQDLEQSKSDFAARLLASVILVFCLAFAVLFGCLVIVALTWDTSYRVVSIACMIGTFLVVAIACAVYRSRIIGAQAPFLGTVRREWAEDRVILEKILSDQE
jgi:uncharacterized membrane protein YqjE